MAGESWEIPTDFIIFIIRVVYFYDPSWSESSFILFLFFYSIRVGPSRSKLIRPGLAVRVDPVRLLYLPLFLFKASCLKVINQCLELGFLSIKASHLTGIYLDHLTKSLFEEKKIEMYHWSFFISITLYCKVINQCLTERIPQHKASHLTGIYLGLITYYVRVNVAAKIKKLEIYYWNWFAG